jgi:beta-galactosidase/beta-glucuronidase
MRKQDFGEGWRFRTKGHAWQDVRLPHDAQLLEKRTADAPGGSGHGYFPGNFYEYEKRFVAAQEWKEQHVELLLEGVYKNATVTLNGKTLAEHAYGYTPFTVDLDEALLYGQENVLTVTADNSRLPNSRWYSGGGIYRPVSLLLGNRDHIRWQGVRISTISTEPAKILVETESTEGEIKVAILDGEHILAQAKGNHAEISLEGAALWSEHHPRLYRCRVTLEKDGKAVDEVTENFGIRSIRWSPEGFFVNGTNTLLRGGCAP